jgi:nucleotide-binding universal stress UspA family protein
MFDRYPPKSVVVGVGGSQAAIRAARWAVDEVAGTNIPLRLLYITKPNPGAGPAKQGRHHWRRRRLCRTRTALLMKWASH